MKLKIGAVEFEGAPEELSKMIGEVATNVGKMTEGIGHEFGVYCQENPEFGRGALLVFYQLASRLTGIGVAAFDYADPDAWRADIPEDSDPETRSGAGFVVDEQGTCQHGDGDVSPDMDTDTEAPAG